MGTSNPLHAKRLGLRAALGNGLAPGDGDGVFSESPFLGSWLGGRSARSGRPTPLPAVPRPRREPARSSWAAREPGPRAGRPVRGPTASARATMRRSRSAANVVRGPRGASRAGPERGEHRAEEARAGGDPATVPVGGRRPGLSPIRRWPQARQPAAPLDLPPPARPGSAGTGQLRCGRPGRLTGPDERDASRPGPRTRDRATVDGPDSPGAGGRGPSDETSASDRPRATTSARPRSRPRRRAASPRPSRSAPPLPRRRPAPAPRLRRARPTSCSR